MARLDYRTSRKAWQLDRRNARRVRYFTPGFNVAVGDLLQTRPHHKATSIGDWDLLAARLSAGFRHAAAGTAFINEEPE